MAMSRVSDFTYGIDWSVQESGIPVPNHIVVSRNEGNEDPPGFEETEDYVAMNGQPL